MRCRASSDSDSSGLSHGSPRMRWCSRPPSALIRGSTWTTSTCPAARLVLPTFLAARIGHSGQERLDETDVWNGNPEDSFLLGCDISIPRRHSANRSDRVCLRVPRGVGQGLVGGPGRRDEDRDRRQAGDIASGDDDAPGRRWIRGRAWSEPHSPARTRRRRRASCLGPRQQCGPLPAGRGTQPSQPRPRSSPRRSASQGPSPQARYSSVPPGEPSPQRSPTATTGP